MMFLPRALSTIADASSAFYRLSHIFHAELITGDTLVIDKTQEHAIVVQKAIFEWESFGKVDGKTIDVTFERGKGAQGKYVKRNNQSTNSPTFKVINITLTIPRGQLAAIVGPVGSGKVFAKYPTLFNAKTNPFPVKSLARYHWGDEEGVGTCISGRQGRILFADGLDTKRYFGVSPPLPVHHGSLTAS